ncbi:MAG: Iron-sulfur cluster-binding protein [Sporomusa sp.]|nr:Iron-sulfur cluster-binding protein [Sporomusa sp.]
MTTTDQSNNNQLTREFKDFIGGLSHGMALVGVASIDRFDNFPTGHGPRDFIADANAVIVIALPIVEGVMGLEHFMEKSEIFKEQDTYTNNEGNTKVWSPRVVVRGHIESRNSHEILNIELQTLSMYSALFLERNGYRTVYMPTTYGNTMSWPGNLDRSLPRAAPQWYGPFSHRHAAVAAGLGEFGLNNLFLTPEYGPRSGWFPLLPPLRSPPIPYWKTQYALARNAPCVSRPVRRKPLATSMKSKSPARKTIRLGSARMTVPSSTKSATKSV